MTQKQLDTLVIGSLLHSFANALNPKVHPVCGVSIGRKKVVKNDFLPVAPQRFNEESQTKSARKPS